MSVSSNILLSRKEKLDSLKDELREFLTDPQFGGTLAERTHSGPQAWSHE